jgi:hypothetical protein
MDFFHASDPHVPRREAGFHSTIGLNLGKARRMQMLVLLLLAGILGLSELAKTGTYLGLPTLTRRFLKLNRIGEPCHQELRAAVVTAPFIRRDIHLPTLVVLGPASADFQIVRPSLILSRSSNLVRSPPDAG